MASAPVVKTSLMLIASPANTATDDPVSVSLAVLAVEARLVLFVAPAVETVTALPTIALAQVLRRVSVATWRLLVSVQTIGPAGVPLMVSRLPTSVVPPVNPVQAKVAP